MNGRPTPSVSWKTAVKTKKDVGSSKSQSENWSGATDVFLNHVHLCGEKFLIESMFRWSVKVALNQIERLILKSRGPSASIDKDYFQGSPDVQQADRLCDWDVDLGNFRGERG